MQMAARPYPKFLAFLALCYPALGKRFDQRSSETDRVAAKFVNANSGNEFNALVFSNGRFCDGDLFKILPCAASSLSVSWDWRWVFGFEVRHQKTPIFHLRFRQRIVALPPSSNVISAKFFQEFLTEFSITIDPWLNDARPSSHTPAERYSAYLDATNRR